MTRARATWEVARWEFLRFFKPKQLLIGLLLTLGGGAVGWGVAALSARGDDRPVEVVVIGAAGVPLTAPEGSRLRLRPAPASEEAELRAAVERGEIAGVVTWGPAGEPRLLAGERPRWKDELESVLTSGVIQSRFARAGVEPEQLPGMLAPVGLRVEYAPSATPPRTPGETLAGILTMVVMVMAVFTGMGYLFAGITGEKQNRVTEQVVAAIPPQSWVDGKILGIAAITVVNLAGTALSFLLLGVAAALFFDFALPPLPKSVGDPWLIGVFLLFMLLGFAFWFAFLAAVAATVDDPNSSSRTGLLFLPVAATGTALVAFNAPDSTLARVLGLLPPTSAAVLPTRLVLTEVAAWEIALAAVLLAGAAWLLRWAAGKIFHLGMLMYGKEPGWREIRRWLGEA